ncbi:MAG: hypothetical protein AAFX62_00685 [Pseudomonadota bacterium]
MSDTNTEVSQSQERARSLIEQLDPDPRRTGGRFLRYSGMLMVAVGASCFAYVLYEVFRGSVFDVAIGPNQPGEADLLFILLTKFGPITYPIIVGTLSTVIGLVMMRSALSVSSKTIPDDDRKLLTELILKHEKDGIDQYIKLSSLLGSTGFFTKLGFTGLPLATVSLTLVLVGLSIYRAPDDAKVEPNLLDMAKLTLGAFIGSFVQRKMQRETIDQ